MCCPSGWRNWKRVDEATNLLDVFVVIIVLFLCCPLFLRKTSKLPPFSVLLCSSHTSFINGSSTPFWFFTHCSRPTGDLSGHYHYQTSIFDNRSSVWVNCISFYSFSRLLHGIASMLIGGVVHSIWNIWAVRYPVIYSFL